jgi:MFS family permease
VSFALRTPKAMKQLQEEIEPTVSARPDQRQRARALWVSSIEGGIAWVWIALQQVFYIPYLKALGASDIEIGLGSSLPALCGGLIQLATPWAVAKFRTRKAIVVTMAFSQGLMYVPLALMWLLPRHPAIWGVIAAFSISTLAGGIHGPAWVDWMGDLIPRRMRGKYFGVRNRVFATIQLAVSVGGGLLLDRGGGAFGKTMVLFSAIWTVSFIFRTFSSICLYIQYEPPYVPQHREKTLSFAQFIGSIWREQFGRFTICSCLLNFGANFSAPFFAVYMLQDLSYTYTTYTVMSMIPVLATIVVMPLWGRFIDRVGTVMPMKAFVVGIASLSLWWVFSANFWWLAAVQMFAGVMWAGYGLASFNYSIEIVTPAKRVSSLAYANVLNSIAIGAGTAAGGAAAPLLPHLFTYRLQSIFLVSCLLRVVPAVMFQFLKQDRRRPSHLTAMEKFFFDPMSILRNGLDRIPFARFIRR